MVEITDSPINSEQALQRMPSPEAGAVVLFLGTTREFTHGRQTRSLEYECYREMAEQKLAELEDTARRQWPVVECLLIHRVGQVGLGETSVLVAVSTPHRQEAFHAAQWLMDAIKQDVPIWKKEHWADGGSQWVHPGITPDQVS